MSNVFLEGLQRPANIPNNNNSGGGSSLPDITAEDEGKVLSVDQGEAVWADAPSGGGGLNLKGSMVGKLMVATGTRSTTEFVPEQTVTLESGDSGYSAVLSNITLMPDDFASGDTATATIGENSYTLPLLEYYGTKMFYDAVSGTAIAYMNDAWTLAMASEGTVTISANVNRYTQIELSGAEEYEILRVTITTSGSTETLDKTFEELQQAFLGSDLATQATMPLKTIMLIRMKDLNEIRVYRATAINISTYSITFFSYGSGSDVIAYTASSASGYPSRTVQN